MMRSGEVCDSNATAPFVIACLVSVVDIAALSFSNRHIGITRDNNYFFFQFDGVLQYVRIFGIFMFAYLSIVFHFIPLQAAYTQSPSVFGSVQNEKVHMASY